MNIDSSPSVFLARHPRLKTILFHLGCISKSNYETQWPKEIVWYDLRRNLPYASKSVSKIYTSHLLEHMDADVGGQLLRECHRVLKPGGILRAVVPDLVFHVRRYLDLVEKDQKCGREPHDEFLNSLYGAFLDIKKKRYGLHHRYMYDFPTLNAILREIGFSDIIRQDYQKSLDEEMAHFDARPGESLHVDAVR